MTSRVGGDPGPSEERSALAGVAVIEAADATVGADVGVARDADAAVADGVAVGAGVSARVGCGVDVAGTGCPDRQPASVNANKSAPIASANRLPVRRLVGGSCSIIGPTTCRATMSC